MSYKIVKAYKAPVRLLISFDSLVASINSDNGRITLYKDWDYGRTTVGHVGRFITAFTPLCVAGKRDILKNMKDGKIIYKDNFVDGF